jgi:endonuclease/exonuclease/phosphatase family metal-dependent hydrolase
MKLRAAGLSWALVAGGGFLWPSRLPAQTFRVATYNLENYLDQPTETRPRPKSDAARAAIRESILALKPDVIALQELGRPATLDELRRSLKAEGLNLPYAEYVAGFDTNIHVGVLSRFSITASRSHTNESFLLSGRRLFVSRGIGEVDIQVSPRYTFTLLTVHLKSKRPVPEADQAEARLQEARILREIVSARLAADPRANLVVAGDLNDTKDSPPLRTLLGRGRYRLVDTRPAEQDGDATGVAAAADPRAITWTHYYGKEDTYSRIDYLLLSPGMAREWLTNETWVLARPNWGVASDHRPLVATFHAEDR